MCSRTKRRGKEKGMESHYCSSESILFVSPSRCIFVFALLASFPTLVPVLVKLGRLFNLTAALQVKEHYISR